MALATGESFSRGFVFASDGSLSITQATAGSRRRYGFLRDPDGRLVVTSG